tara:strand:+ start:22773 stop:23297 length:525 start_codon:yes stop_codon:yes gene_type:complete
MLSNKKTQVKVIKKGIKYICESEKIDRAREKLEVIINSDTFKEKVRNYISYGKKQFIQNNGFSNEEVLQRLLEGSEILNKRIDYLWEVHLTIIKRPWYKRFSSVNGFTYPNTLEIKIYRDSFNSMSDAFLAAFMAHEQCHNLGFEHDFRRTARRPFSVPYAVGGIISKLIREVY